MFVKTTNDTTEERLKTGEKFKKFSKNKPGLFFLDFGMCSSNKTKFRNS